jgi:hypothetical protein
MTFECGVPFDDQRLLDKETLEGMIDGMGLKGVLRLLEEIACARPNIFSISKIGL